jgi:hypothetical protein
MTRVRKYKRPEMWDMGVVHSSIMKKVDWSSSEKEELVLVGVKRFLGAGRSRFQPPTHVQTVVETTNQKKKRKKNLLLGFPSSTGELQEHGGGDGTSRVLSGVQLVAAAAADHHHQAATLVDLAVQNGVMDARIGKSTGPAAAAFVALDQAEEEEEEEEDKSALKYPSALAAHVCSSPVDVDQELAAAASKDENITRHYLGSLGITKTGACSSSSQLRAAAATGEEEEDKEEASYQEGKANSSPFLQLQQQHQQEVVAGMNAKSLLLAAAGATTKTTTAGSAEVHSEMFKPIRSSISYIQ